MSQPLSLIDANVQILIAGYFPCKPDWKIPLAKASNDCLFFIEKGTGWVDYEGKRIDIRPGDLFLFKRDNFHELGHDKHNPLSVYSVLFYFDQHDGRRPLDWLNLSRRIHLNAKEQKEIINIYKDIIDNFKTNKPENDLHAKINLFKLIINVLTWEKQKPSKDKVADDNKNVKNISRTKDAITYIYQHINQAVTVSELSDLCHLTPSHFTKMFKKETGENPKDFINKVKMNHAKSLMISTDKTILQICKEIGISDSFYFSRAFKKMTGLAPTEFRKSLKNPWF